MRTAQEKEWLEGFGPEYTRRNLQSLEQMEEMHRKRYGATRTELNARFLGGLPRDLRILEVGTNVGNQLLCLRAMGFRRLAGVELQEEAARLAKKRVEEAEILRGSAFALPFRDGAFDLVFTSGVLIHISPPDIGRALAEIVRCTARYVWGLEYFAPLYTEVKYRGHDALLWKTDFGRLYRESFPALESVREERLPYIGEQLEDSMFLLRKK
jgi:pseudaminic acid biosynthesis-associated methylase